MAVTIHDVAKHAGVSHTTVSWVIHDDPRITEGTKIKVRNSIDKLNYHPNVNARSLIRGKSNTIAVIVYFFSSIFELEVLKGIEQYFDEIAGDYNVNIYSTRGNCKRKEKILKEILYGQRADAVIMLSMNPGNDLLQEYRKENVPLVLIEESIKGALTVKNDNIGGAYMATEHLIKTGRKNIGIVVGEYESDESGLSPSERLEGYKRALEDYNLIFNPDLVFTIDNYYFEEGQVALQFILEKEIHVDALFCAAGDTVAIGILDQARKSGISIPEELSVVGYDDIHAAALVSPALTTIRQPIESLGITALEMVMKALSGKKVAIKDIVFDQKLIVRSSA